jgi:hypothetical protein
MARRTFFKTGQLPTQIAYLAGIIDGEGCFYIGKIKHNPTSPNQQKQQWHVMVKITSCDIVLIDWLREHFTGCSENTYRWTAKKAFYRGVYSWSLGGNALDYFLPLLDPFLTIKKEHCKVMIDIRKTFKKGGNQSLSDEILQKRQDLMIKMRKLNSRFHNHILKQN